MCGLIAFFAFSDNYIASRVDMANNSTSSQNKNNNFGEYALNLEEPTSKELFILSLPKAHAWSHGTRAHAAFGHRRLLIGSLDMRAPPPPVTS